MKNIVLYYLISAAGLLLMTTGAIGQKPTIDLLPTNHQRIHPETMVDSGGPGDTLRIIDRTSQSYNPHSEKREPKSIRSRETRRNWYQLDSLFRKKEVKNNHINNSSVEHLLILKYFYPIHFIVHITALKL